MHHSHVLSNAISRANHCMFLGCGKNTGLLLSSSPLPPPVSSSPSLEQVPLPCGWSPNGDYQDTSHYWGKPHRICILNASRPTLASSLEFFVHPYHLVRDGEGDGLSLCHLTTPTSAQELPDGRRRMRASAGKQCTLKNLTWQLTFSFFSFFIFHLRWSDSCATFLDDTYIFYHLFSPFRGKENGRPGE